MIYGSVCSGIEAASVAFEPLGWKPAFFSEIDAFPRAVLKHHYPDVKLYGDFRQIPTGTHAIDLLIGGTPCQSFSVAGLRQGLDAATGNLALEYIKLAARLRPRWLVWENVPGLLSIDSGRAFGSFIGGLVQCGYSVAWRILDARHFGVPQRRRRIFVVGYLGTDWRPPSAVLFERESLLGNIETRRKERQDVTGTIGSRAKSGGGFGGDFECAGRVQAVNIVGCRSSAGGTSRKHGHGWGQQDFENGYAIPVEITHSLRADGFDASEDGTGRGTPIIPVSYSLRNDAGRDGSAKTPSADAEGNVRLRDPGFNVYEEIAPTLDSTLPPSVMSFDLRGREGGAMPESEHDTASERASSGGSSRSYVAFSPHHDEHEGRGANFKSTDTNPALRGPNGTDNTLIAFNARQDPDVYEDRTGLLDQDGSSHAIAFDLRNISATPQANTLQSHEGGVRRLTPTECERLQGFPDVKKSVIITVCCPEDQKNCVNAEILNLRSLKYVSNVEGSDQYQSVKSVEVPSGINHRDHGAPVVLNVHLDLEHNILRIRSEEGENLWYANTVELSKSALHHVLLEDFVRVLALTHIIPGRIIQDGGEELLKNTTSSTLHLNGSRCVDVSGLEIREYAKDVAKSMNVLYQCLLSITSGVGLSSLNSDLFWKTWSSYVVLAIDSFIPEKISKENTYSVSVVVTSSYTKVPYRGKKACDGPRYKAIGNSFAVPVVRWIGQRIQMVEDILKCYDQVPERPTTRNSDQTSHGGYSIETNGSYELNQGEIGARTQF